MPMGLTNAPATFMRAMNNLFADLLDNGVIIFLDDVLIYSATWSEHLALLRAVMDRLRQHQFYCKLKKCQFGKATTTVLGFDVTSDGMKISTEKIKSLKD